MIQEEKQLLLKDLCARAPYGVKVDVSKVKERKGLTLTPFILSNYYDDIEKIKPYLRPMDCMTYNQQKEYIDLLKRMINTNDADILYTSSILLIDFFNREHIDYRGLIEKDLALEAPKDMYKTE